MELVVYREKIKVRCRV